jgi:RNA polymerase sigma-70 factor (ECF subfamily)
MRHSQTEGLCGLRRCERPSKYLMRWRVRSIRELCESAPGEMGKGLFWLSSGAEAQTFLERLFGTTEVVPLRFSPSSHFGLWKARFQSVLRIVFSARAKARVPSLALFGPAKAVPLLPGHGFVLSSAANAVPYFGSFVAGGGVGDLGIGGLVVARRADDPKSRGLKGSGNGGPKRPLTGYGGDPGTGENPETDAESDPENEGFAQHSDDDGVPEDMATLVLDKSGLGSGLGPGASSASGQAVLTAGPLGSVNYAADASSDAAVMLRVAAGDEASYNYLVGKYHRAMINFLYRMVHNQAVAEELAQEVFLRVYRSRESYRAEAKFTTWLYRIATNLAVNHARDTKHERSAQNVYLDAPDEESGTTPDVADDTPTVEQTMLRVERLAAIRGQVMELPEVQRMAVLMH